MRAGERIGQGNTADVFEWGAHEVLKLFHERHWAMEEARNAERIGGLGLRTPRFGGVIEYEGRLGIVYERVDGSTMLRSIEPNEASVARNARLMASLQVEIQSVEHSFEPNLIEELTRKIKAAPCLADVQKEALLRLAGTMPVGRSLCHYDFHPDNIIMSPGGPVVIDWMNVLVGDPAADAARTAMMFQSTAVPPGAPAWLTEGNYRQSFYREYMDEYRSLTGIAQEALESWMLPTLAARIVEMRAGWQTEIWIRVEDGMKRLAGV